MERSNVLLPGSHQECSRNVLPRLDQRNAGVQLLEPVLILGEHTLNHHTDQSTPGGVRLSAASKFSGRGPGADLGIPIAFRFTPPRFWYAHSL